MISYSTAFSKNHSVLRIHTAVLKEMQFLSLEIILIAIVVAVHTALSCSQQMIHLFFIMSLILNSAAAQKTEHRSNSAQ